MPLDNTRNLTLAGTTAEEVQSKARRLTPHPMMTLCAMALCLVLGATSLRAAPSEHRDTVWIYFSPGSSDVVAGFHGNASRIDAMASRIKAQAAPGDPVVRQVAIKAACSPEGGAKVNDRISKDRAANVAKYLHGILQFDDGDVVLNDIGIDWDNLQELVIADKSCPGRLDILRCVDNEDVSGLQSLAGGKVWSYIYGKVFPSLRYAVVTVDYDKPKPTYTVEDNFNPATEGPVVTAEDEPEVQNPPAAEEVPGNVGKPDGETNVIKPQVQEETKVKKFYVEPKDRNWYLKTNIIPWFLLDANLAAEWEISDHMSFSLPIYYNALDWFNVESKFRVLGTQPELRYWFKDDFSGLFLGAHFTYSYYNISWNTWTYRYQDKGWKNPALGGGINVGYKLRLRPLGDHWGLEFTLGAGYLHLDYDTFYNVANGRHAGSFTKNYFGIDNASVSLTYRFAQ